LVTNDPKADINLWYFATLVLGTAGIVFLLYKCIKEFKLHSQDFGKYSLILIWFIFGIGLVGFYKKSIYDYYFGFMFPLPFLIVGMLLKSLWTNKAGKAFSIFVLIVLVWLNSLTAPFALPANRQLDQMESIARFVIGKTDNKPFNFALIAQGNSDHAYRYFFAVWGKEPTVIQNVAVDPQRKTVTNQLLVVCEQVSCGPLGYSEWEIAGFGRAQIAGEWSVSVVKVFKLVHYVGK
jgi:hypothetical protein